jgi:hypothetical protein
MNFANPVAARGCDGFFGLLTTGTVGLTLALESG